MLAHLRLTHRLLLIYLLSFVSVAVLAYSLIVEKNIAIDIAQKELRGNAYAAVARDTLLAVIKDRLASTPSLGKDRVAARVALQAQIAALEAAERKFGLGLDTAALADGLAGLLGQLSKLTDGDPRTEWALHIRSMRSARELIARIGDQSNLILDPDLDSYYMMSIAILRLPEVATASIDLVDSATASRPDSAHSNESNASLALRKGAFSATLAALASDNVRAIGVNTDGAVRSKLQTSFLRLQSAATKLSANLRTPGVERSTALTALHHLTLATEAYWTLVDAELDRLLQQRVDQLYRRMAFDLGLAALVWLMALGLILFLARQITRPIRELAAVAERVRHGEDYSMRAPIRAGGEIGSLVGGFNAMLDRLQREATREQERVARGRAATAQRQLLEAIPVTISVVSEVDGRVLYTNTESARPSWLPYRATGDLSNVLGSLLPSDRTAFLEAFRSSRHVDGFEARCQASNGETFWVLINARAMTYQGEPARLEAYTPINDRKLAESTLARRDAVLDAIAYAATRLVGAVDWGSAMPEFLSRLGVATEVDRVFLFEIHQAPSGTGRAQSCRFMWSAPGITPIADHGELDNDPLPDNEDTQFAEWFRRRDRGEVIQVTREQTRDDARRLFEETSTYSMLSVPIMVDGVFWGSLGFDDCRRERIWDEMEVDLLKTATALIAGAIERSQADEKLRERDNQLIEAQRIAHVGSWELDFGTNLVSWSVEGWRIFGLEPGRDSWSHAENLQRIHPDDRDRVAGVDKSAKECGAPIDIEYRIIRPGGEVRVVHERAESVCDEAGRPTRMIGTVHDVTALKATEARLRESDERYSLAVRGADVGLLDWDITTDNAYYSPRLCEILGVGNRDLGSSISGLLNEIAPDDQAALHEYLKSRFDQQRRRFEIEVRGRSPANNPQWLVVRGLIVYTEGRPVRLVGSLRDVTDKKHSDDELVRQREALYQSEKMAMFGSLLAGVAHELNNPLSVVIGQIALLQETVADPAVIRRAERIRGAAERCARIVRTFLAMARQRHAEPKPVDINGVVEMAVDLLAYQLRSSSIRVDLDLADNLPAVAADADQIHQVLTNLIVNALQALTSSDLPRRIRISSGLDHAGRQIQLSVTDNGPGVPDEICNRIFEPFFTTKPVGEGTGIGLSLSSSIVRAHGGQLTVSRNAEGGATFMIVLPLRGDARSVQSEIHWSNLPPGLRVLIVEDEVEIADTLKEILRRNGHDADVVANGHQALNCAVSASYDLIVSDMRMPVLDGPRFYEALQRERPEILDRVVFITGDTLSTEIQSFLQQTNALCIEKPFLPDDVLRLLFQAMERRSIVKNGVPDRENQAAYGKLT